MSGEPKTLTLTLEEAAVLLHERRDGHLTLEGEVWTATVEEPGPVIYGMVSVESKGFEGRSWPEVVSRALGVRVVARDEAAELRAAIREWDDALTKLNALIHGIPGHRDDVNAADDRLTAAEANLRRLAGGENDQ